MDAVSKPIIPPRRKNSGCNRTVTVSNQEIMPTIHLVKVRYDVGQSRVKAINLSIEVNALKVNFTTDEIMPNAGSPYYEHPA